MTRIALAAALMFATAVPAAELDIPFDTFKLDNGLTVVVHEDKKAPVVAVSIWYHVGSKDEKPGRTGFAHLFEHLMFQGTENYNDEYFKPFERVGATDMNGTTWLDRTNYFQTVPKTALDMALWMESDRMGHLLGVIDQARLDEQRGVVKNEKRQGENSPYGRVFEALQRASFPEGHPYRWTTIGSMEDLEAASLDDVKDWFKQYYGAANATLVLAGDVTLAEAKEKVQRHFGHIDAGPPLTRMEAWVAPRSEGTREVMFDRVAQSRVHMAWNVAQLGTADADYLEIAAQVLGQGKTSRLYQRLVQNDRIADSVVAYPMIFELAGLFVIQADVKAGVPMATVETAIAEELQRLLDGGPTPEELAAARTELRSNFVRGIQRVGGFAGKAGVLAECAVYQDDPGCFRVSLQRQLDASASDVAGAAKRWLSRGKYTLEVHPQPKYSNSETSAVDRSKGVPVVASFPEVDFPAIDRASLKNGVPVVLAARGGVPLVNVELLFDGGTAADVGRPTGTASFTFSMLDEGAGKRDSLAIANALKGLGAEFSAGAGLDFGNVGVSSLTEQIDPSLAILADLVRRPTFPDKEIERVRQQWLAGIKQEKSEPNSLGFRLMPRLLYGESHPYSAPFTGSGTEASIAALKREDLLAYHAAAIRPDNARILVSGDIRMDELLPLLEKHFGDWRAPSVAKAEVSLPAVPMPGSQRVFLLDRPDAPQTVIMAGHLAPNSLAPNLTDIGTMNSILGGGFTSRINMNLREEKHWSYGAGISLPNALGQRPWIVIAPVQTDKSAESIVEIKSEIAGYLGDEPATEDELSKIKERDVRSLPGAFETIGAVQGALRSIVQYNRPDDYVRQSKARIEAQTLETVRAAAKEVIQPQALTWVVVGDLSKIEASVRALDLGPVTVVDEDGNPVP